MNSIGFNMINKVTWVENLAPNFRDDIDLLSDEERAIIFIHHNKFDSLYKPEIPKLSGQKGYYFDRSPDNIRTHIATTFIFHTSNPKKLEVTERILDELG